MATPSLEASRPAPRPAFLARVIHHDRLVVGVIAILAAGIWYLSEPIVFTNDSFGYVWAAKYIAGVSAHGIPYYRMPLFPLFLAATGVARYSTFSWFILTQTALGIAMVVLFHDGLRGYSRKAALLATIVFTFTFVPFVYSKSVMTEQVYLTGLILCLSNVLVFFQTGSRLRLALVAAAVLIMMLTRVQGMLIGFIVFPFLLFGRRNDWKPIATAAAVVIVTIGAYALVYSAQVRKHQLFLSEGTTQPSLSNSVGKYLFMVPYLDASRYFGWIIVEPQNGPASKELFSLTEDKPPTLEQWWAIWQGLDKKIGVAASNNLLLRATIEAALAHPFRASIVYAHNLVIATYRLNSSYVWEHPPVTIDDDLLNAEFKASGDQSAVSALAKLANFLFRAALLICTVLVVVTAGPHGKAWAFCIALYGYNLVSIAASGAPEGRIVFYGLPLVLAALATAQARPWLMSRLRYGRR